MRRNTVRKHAAPVLTALILALLMCLGLGAATAVYGAEGTDSGTYTYRVTIYAGQQGTFQTGKVWKKDLKAGESISISLEDLGFTLKDDKYYVRGFRVTGHDNDETTGIQRLQIDNIDTDVAYELAYGIRGAMVEYTVNYVDADGKELRASDTYHGMPGDKPVVSYRYVEGYTPNAYNQGKTLVENAEENVFTFVYTKDPTPAPAAPTTPAQGQNGNTNGNANGNGNVNGNGNANVNAGAGNAAGNGAMAPGTTGNPAGTAVPEGEGLTNIGDNDTPLADGPQQYVDLDDEETPLAAGQFGKKSMPVLIGSIVVLLAGIFLIILAIRRRKNRQAEAQA